MREKGLTYKVNFGVELPRLQQMAQEMPHTYELAARLWKEDIRECRLLAGMLMPAADFQADMAEVWVEQMRLPRSRMQRDALVLPHGLGLAKSI